LEVIKNRRLEDIVLVDNNIFSFAFQLENGIPVVPFFDDSSDMELAFLRQYLLEHVLSCENVREENSRSFELEKLVEIAREELFD